MIKINASHLNIHTLIGFIEIIRLKWYLKSKDATKYACGPRVRTQADQNSPQHLAPTP